MSDADFRKTDDEIAAMRRAGNALISLRETLSSAVHPGINKEGLDRLAREWYREQGMLSAFFGYSGYPAYVTTSVNDEIVRGIPDSNVLRDGDLLKLELGTIVDGLYSMTAVTLGVGQLGAGSSDLLESARRACQAGVLVARMGRSVNDIGWAIAQSAARRGCSVVRQYGGCGIGRLMHEEPEIPIPGLGVHGSSASIEADTTLYIVAIVNAGGADTKMNENTWTALTADGSLSAMFGHTVLITTEGPEVLTAEDNADWVLAPEPTGRH